MAKYSATNYEKNYNDIYKQQKKAINAQYNAQKAQADYQKKNIEREYDSARAVSYVQARLNAKSTNEQTAAMGLQRGTGAATSGYSDTQRAAQNNALQSGINALNVEEQQQKEALAQEIINAGYTRDADTAAALAEIKLQQLQTQQGEKQYTYQAEQAAAQEAYQKALNRAKILGYVSTAADAKILGVKKGTKIT